MSAPELWLENIPFECCAMRAAQGLVVGDPQPCESGTTQNLIDNGYVGIYAPNQERYEEFFAALEKLAWLAT